MFVIGLDCAAPELVFDRWWNELPNLRFLAGNGLWGDLESCIPAITVPAWTCMLSGKDPGELGVYGFRNRADYSYDKMFIAAGNAVRTKRVWDYLSEAGKRSVVIGVPQTYPVKPLNGYLISGFLTPGIQSEFTYPPALKQEVLAIAPDYDVDVPQFRTDDKDRLLRQIWEMTEKRFRVVDHLLTSKPWDFFMVMEIGVDRIHHGFWSYHDPQHRRYEPGNPYENAIRDYYILIDKKIGEWLDRLDKDTVVLVVSDHGAKRMDGGICINEWLWREGYLAFKQDPEPGQITPFEKLEVDWSRTKAWGSGGYYGRVFLNVQGREPEGVIPPEEYEAVRDELAERIRAIPGPDGRDIGTRVFKPQEIYREVNGVAPDLMVYFGDLLWRSVGSLGHGDIYTFEN
ncbi:MAG TPA: phosphodiesterase, partial [Caldilineae bacterium]|nr:phosphodiesterase [Caldilineae bacterium]